MVSRLSGFLPSYSVVVLFPRKACCWCFMAELFEVSDSSISSISLLDVSLEKSPSCTNGWEKTPTSLSHFKPWTGDSDFMFFLLNTVCNPPKSLKISDWLNELPSDFVGEGFPSGHQGTMMLHLPRLINILCRLKKKWNVYFHSFPFNIEESLSNKTIQNKFRRQKEKIPCDNSPVNALYTNDTAKHCVVAQWHCRFFLPTRRVFKSISWKRFRLKLRACDTLRWLERVNLTGGWWWWWWWIMIGKDGWKKGTNLIEDSPKTPVLYQYVVFFLKHENQRDVNENQHRNQNLRAAALEIVLQTSWVSRFPAFVLFAVSRF